MTRSPSPARDPAPLPAPASGLRRWLYGALGVVLVGLGAVGAVLPGLPTTIFLIGAIWCFARSFPSLADRVLHARIFRPVRGWIEPGGQVSRRAKIGALLLMWAAIGFTVHLFLWGESPNWWGGGSVVVLGLIGTFFIVRHGRPSVRRATAAAEPKAVR